MSVHSTYTRWHITPSFSGSVGVLFGSGTAARYVLDGKDSVHTESFWLTASGSGLSAGLPAGFTFSTPSMPSGGTNVLFRGRNLRASDLRGGGLLIEAAAARGSGLGLQVLVFYRASHYAQAAGRFLTPGSGTSAGLAQAGLQFLRDINRALQVYQRSGRVALPRAVPALAFCFGALSGGTISATVYLPTYGVHTRQGPTRFNSQQQMQPMKPIPQQPMRPLPPLRPMQPVSSQRRRTGRY